MMISLFDRVEDTVGKGQNADYQHFLLFPRCFSKPSSSGSLKVSIVWKRVKPVLCMGKGIETELNYLQTYIEKFMSYPSWVIFELLSANKF